MIIPSIASADQLRLFDALQHFSGYPLHVDIEDGNFTPNITFGLKTVRSIAANYTGRLDVHLFVTEPDRYIDELAKCNVWGICFQVEAEPFPLRTLNHIRSYGIKAGVGLNISTLPESIEVFSSSIDYVIAMTGEPDYGEMNFYPSVLSKIQKMRNVLPKNIEIWADGGVNKNNLESCVAHGADHAIFGRVAYNPIIELGELASLNKVFGDDGSDIVSIKESGEWKDVLSAKVNCT